MALSSLEKLHINSSQLQLYHMQNVDNNTLQESREVISIMWTQSFVHRKKLWVGTVMVMVKVVGGDAGGNDSDGGPKTGIWTRSSNSNCYLYFYYWDSLRRIVNKSRIPFEKSGETALIRSVITKYSQPSISTVSASVRQPTEDWNYLEKEFQHIPKSKTWFCTGN